MGIYATLSGTGMLKVKGVEIGLAEYEIDLMENGRARSGSGTIRAETAVLWSAFEASDLTVTREDTGKDISIIVERFQGGSDTAPVKLNGSPD